MKTLSYFITHILFSLAILLSATAYAYEPAQLQVEMSNVPKNKYFLCISSVGCVNLQSNKQTLLIDPIAVRYMFLAETATAQMFPQPLASSCNVSVNGNQKLIVKGSIVKSSNKTYISNLHCLVV